MCMITEIGSRAKQYAHSLLTSGCINGEQYQAVLEQLKEQMALCATALMGEVRLRTNAIVNERMAMEQIAREVMSFIAGREQEKRRRRRASVAAFSKLREMQPPEYQEIPLDEIPKVTHRVFMVRYPALELEEIRSF